MVEKVNSYESGRRKQYMLSTVISLAIFITSCETGSDKITSCVSNVICSCKVMYSYHIAKALLIEKKSVNDVDSVGGENNRILRLRLEVKVPLKTFSEPYGWTEGEIIEGVWGGSTVCTRDQMELQIGDTVALFVRMGNELEKTIRLAHWNDTDINLSTEDAPVKIPTDELGVFFDEPKCEERLDLSQIPEIPCNDVDHDNAEGEYPDDTPPQRQYTVGSHKHLNI